ncbi:EAL domain-containing protein [Xanthobacter sp. 91]|uniref:EAL domain-containing response regulator n=1 Tax=Xanthobacter sp. 91 TaxID=1117244 RepID=UPI0009DDEC91|nr:EAL domain-containing protein [Xanthobacter sp. 91]
MSAERDPVNHRAGRANLRRILILDDDDAFREDLAEYLTFAGHQVDHTSQPETLTPARMCQTDILLLDLNMPGIDGVDVLRNLCRCVLSPQVVLISGSDVDVIAAAAEAGRMSNIRVLGTLHKPFDPEDLLALIGGDAAQEFDRGAPGGAPSEAQVIASVEASLAADTVPVKFQPKCHPDHRTFAGAEALLGDVWPGLGRISPSAVIAAASVNPDLMRRLTLRVVETAARGAAAWQAAGLRGPVSINMPLDILTERQASNLLATTVRNAGLTPADVILELTEDALYGSSSDALMALAQMRMAGFGIALDDVGQRQSGLLQLASLPITEMKVDRALIVKSRHTEKSRKILEALIQLGHQLRLKVVAEGIETEEDLSRVKAMGADLVQGFLISRKLALAELIAMFKEWNKPDTTTGDVKVEEAQREDAKPDNAQ